MFLADKSLRRYVGLYQQFLYKIFSILLTPTLPNILLTPPPMQKRMILGQGAQCYVLPKKLHPSEFISAHFPNALLTQHLGWTVQDAPPFISTFGRQQRHREASENPPGRPRRRADDQRARLHTPTFSCLLVLHSGGA